MFGCSRAVGPSWQVYSAGRPMGRFERGIGQRSTTVMVSADMACVPGSKAPRAVTRNTGEVGDVNASRGAERRDEGVDVGVQLECAMLHDRVAPNGAGAATPRPLPVRIQPRTLRRRTTHLHHPRHLVVLPIPGQAPWHRRFSHRLCLVCPAFREGPDKLRVAHSHGLVDGSNRPCCAPVARRARRGDPPV